MIKYLRSILGFDGVHLSDVAWPTNDLMPITEAYDPSNTYATYDEEMVKIVPIVDPGHAANETE